MTKLTDQQSVVLEAAQAAKARMDERLLELKARHTAEIYDAEAPLRQAVLDAAREGVPIRQIGIKALSTQDYATVRRLLPDKLDGVADAPAPRQHSVIKGKPTIEVMPDNRLLITDVHGNHWEFWTLDFDGHLVVERSDLDVRSKPTKDLPVPFEVMTALRGKHPKADFSAIDLEE